MIEDIVKFREFFVDHPQRGIGSANCKLIKLVSYDPDKIMDLVYAECFQMLSIVEDSDSASTMSEWTDVDDTDEDDTDAADTDEDADEE